MLCLLLYRGYNILKQSSLSSHSKAQGMVALGHIVSLIVSGLAWPLFQVLIVSMHDWTGLFTLRPRGRMVTPG